MLDITFDSKLMRSSYDLFCIADSDTNPKIAIPSVLGRTILLPDGECWLILMLVLLVLLLPEVGAASERRYLMVVLPLERYVNMLLPHCGYSVLAESMRVERLQNCALCREFFCNGLPRDDV